MKRAVFLFLTASVLLVSCDVRKKDKQARLPAEIKDPTTVQVIDTVFNFGKINEGDIIEFSYRFKNTGQKPLIITEQPKASCGCTVAERPEEPIMPGDTGYIKVKFDSNNKPGEAHKTVIVSSNANPGFPELVLQGEVIGKGSSN